MFYKLVDETGRILNVLKDCCPLDYVEATEDEFNAFDASKTKIQVGTICQPDLD